MKVGFVDTSSLTANDITRIGEDSGVHLSQAGAEKLAGLWLKALKSLGVKDGTIDAGRGAAGTPADDTPPVVETPAKDLPDGGSGKPVKAVDDDMWQTGVADTRWQNARPLHRNDKGGDGELTATTASPQ